MIANKHITLIMGGLLGAVCLIKTPDAWEKLSDVHQRQVIANERLVEWKAAYQALLPVNARWDKTYPSGDDVQDLVSLYRLVDLERHGLTANVDLVRQNLAEAVNVNGLAVGLQRLCISNGPEYLEVTAPNIRALRVGLASLAARKDIDLGSIQVSFDEESGQPLARVTQLCLKVRTEKQQPAGVTI